MEPVTTHLMLLQTIIAPNNSARFIALKQKGPRTRGRRKAAAGPLLTVTLHNLGHTVVALILNTCSVTLKRSVNSLCFPQSNPHASYDLNVGVFI